MGSEDIYYEVIRNRMEKIILTLCAWRNKERSWEKREKNIEKIIIKTWKTFFTNKQKRYGETYEKI